MRSSAPVVVIALALAACSSGPQSSLPAGGAAGRAPEPPVAAAAQAAPRPSPSGDRHARAAARRAPVVKRADGTLAERDGRTVVVARPGAPPLILRVAPGTAVTLDGRTARADALPPGADVRAAYRTGDGGRPTALSIEARRPAAGPAPPSAEPAAPAEEPPGSLPWEASPEPTTPDGG